MNSEQSRDKKSATLINIFLIGMMGSGKTFWAEQLKKKLKIAAYDLDSLIEIMEEKSVAEIFQQDGEPYYRKEEAKMLRLFAEKKQYILSCGGGTPCFNNNMEWMNKQGITIWIDVPIEILAERLLKEKEKRPLLKDIKEDGIKDFLKIKSEERWPFYSKAKYRLQGEKITLQNFQKIINQHA